MSPLKLGGDSLKDATSPKNLYFRRRGTGGSGRAAGVAFACLAAMLAVCGALPATGCSRASKRAPGSLLERFEPALPAADRSSVLNPVVVDRGGLKKSAMVLVAPAAARAPLEGFQGRIELHLAVAPVFNVGDGIQMEIWLLEDGSPVRVFSRYFDAGRRFEDRRWTPVSVTMDVHQKAAQLEIRVSGGPEGDLAGDWLAFADLRISSIEAERQ